MLVSNICCKRGAITQKGMMGSSQSHPKKNVPASTEYSKSAGNLATHGPSLPYHIGCVINIYK